MRGLFQKTSFAHWLQKSFPYLLVYFFLALIGPILTYRLPSHINFSFGVKNPDGQKITIDQYSFHEFDIKNQKQNLEKKIYYYHIRNNHYPYSLAEIDGIDASKWTYFREKDTYTLHRK
ncbi:MAG: hypothetical protein KDD52_05030 [Bdellovibrionales bacterium]|nr:hypothetical protein [Bdellovibrionales bacterium]